ncbi:hypothetical protein OCU04_007334 [Sclerotinia nivalis]|uniref:Uncharacterized protein n=1 Tax=Sclerotinia nivalis TaxID=352851 RepID=A0A9X0AJL3_9HELO|nr:hypothetical protein OCU04_007334 [Sclerotinia nivalis]
MKALRTLHLSVAAIRGLSLVEETNNRANLIILFVIVPPMPDRFCPTYAMVDSRCKGYAFVDRSWIEAIKLLIYKLSVSFEVIRFDGKILPENRMDRYILINLQINDYYEKRSKIYITELIHYPIVLGLA